MDLRINNIWLQRIIMKIIQPGTKETVPRIKNIKQKQLHKKKLNQPNK